MVTREEVIRLLDGGHTYQTAARQLGIPAGLAFMIATGLPADGGDGPAPEELRDRRVLPGSSQSLVNPPPFNPTRSSTVMSWVQERAGRELAQGS